MEKLIAEIQLFANSGIPSDDILGPQFRGDTGWPHFCALQILEALPSPDELVLLENGGVFDDLDFGRGAIDHPDVHVPRSVVAWFAMTSFLLAVAGNT